MNPKVTPLLLLSLLLATGCGEPQKLTYAQKHEMKVELAETVIRYQVEHHVYGEDALPYQYGPFYSLKKPYKDELAARIKNIQGAKLMEAVPKDFKGIYSDLAIHIENFRKPTRRKLVAVDRWEHPISAASSRTHSIYLLDRGSSGWAIIGQCQKTSNSLAEKPKVKKMEELPNEKRDIYEALFRYQIKSGLDGNRVNRQDTCFLSINDSDPDAAFLERFSNLPNPVKGKSEVKKDKHGNVIDGILFNAGSIVKVNPSMRFVSGGYYVGPLGASGCLYVVERTLFGWKVTDYFMFWIS